MRNKKLIFIFCLLAALLLTISFVACSKKPWNNPYPASEARANIGYSSFSESPKTLDPALSYSVNEAIFTTQIYEPPLQYHYLKRPYTLIPLTATRVPKPAYLDAAGKPLPDTASAKEVAYSVYTIRIKSHINYQPHPALAKDEKGHYLYHHLKESDLDPIYELRDFKQQGTRELIADDYVYEIKRLAHPKQVSPIFGLMSEYIVGLSDYAATLQKAYAKQLQHNQSNTFLDLRRFPLKGATVLNRYTFRITLKGKYPQFIYWLAMPFFSPIPWEADKFYSQEGMQDSDITLGWYPIGTGPYQLIENNPNRQMVLARNPYFHAEYYPQEGGPDDAKKGYLEDAGKRLPLTDKFIFTLEKESIPRWTKFLQGYYDQSAVSSDSFDQVVQISENGIPQLTKAMLDKKIRLQTDTAIASFYTGFNMMDDVVGGYSEKAAKLRQALSIAFNQEEFIAIFLNGRGVPAQGPLPPGIFGYREKEAGMNPYVYRWVQDKAVRRSLEEAKALLAEAGYPEGRDPKTGRPLILNYDVPISSKQDDASMLTWVRRQFAQLGIHVNVRDTQYNRFQEKMRVGNAQIFAWGWLGDYPDPENFLFLLYGPNGKVRYGGENAANYHNASFDALYERMKNLPDGPERQAVINNMVAIARHDAPWIWGYYPQNFQLSHAWVHPAKLNEVGGNTLKYMRLDPIARDKARRAWNQPVLWPLGLILLLLAAGLVPVFIQYWIKEYQGK